MVAEPSTWAARALTEARKSPLQVMFGCISAIAGALSLYVAWRTGGPSFAEPTATSAATTPTNGYLVAFSAMIALSATAALLARLTRLSSWIAAYFGSVVYASAAAFLITLVIRTQGVRFGVKTDQPSATLWIVYATIFAVFATFNGERLVRDIVAFEQQSVTRVEGKGPTVGDIGFSVAVVTFVWALSVRVGTDALCSGLLT